MQRAGARPVELGGGDEDTVDLRDRGAQLRNRDGLVVGGVEVSVVGRQVPEAVIDLQLHPGRQRERRRPEEGRPDQVLRPA